MITLSAEKEIILGLLPEALIQPSWSATANLQRTSRPSVVSFGRHRQKLVMGQRSFPRSVTRRRRRLLFILPAGSARRHTWTGWPHPVKLVPGTTRRRWRRPRRDGEDHQQQREISRGHREMSASFAPQATIPSCSSGSRKTAPPPSSAPAQAVFVADSLAWPPRTLHDADRLAVAAAVRPSVGVPADHGREAGVHAKLPRRKGEEKRFRPDAMNSPPVRSLHHFRVGGQAG